VNYESVKHSIRGGEEKIGRNSVHFKFEFAQYMPRQNPSRLFQRQKQIDYGKNTVGYEKYIKIIPKSSRRLSDPQTPNIHSSTSKRAFDGAVKKWRRALHKYDCIFFETDQIFNSSAITRVKKSLTFTSSRGFNSENFKETSNITAIRSVRGAKLIKQSVEKWENLENFHRFVL